jgi:hypothetical protein
MAEVTVMAATAVAAGDGVGGCGGRGVAEEVFVGMEACTAAGWRLEGGVDLRESRSNNNRGIKEGAPGCAKTTLSKGSRIDHS